MFLSTMLAVALAALNTGNNLLYLVLSAMLALVAVSSVLSEWSIRSLRVSRTLEEEAFAGQPVAGRWQVHNPRSLTTAIDIRLEEVSTRHASLVGTTQAEVNEIGAACRATAPATWCFAQRGIHRIEAVRISTSWPFGIFRKWYEREAQMDVLVFPRRGRRAQDKPSFVSTTGTSERVLARSRPSARGDFFGLREHRVGDDPRMIHWRSSARRGQLLSVENEATGSSRKVELRVDAPVASDLMQRSQLFEERIEEATARICDLLDDGSEVRLILLGKPLTPARGAPGRHYLLRSLALVELPEGDR